MAKFLTAEWRKLIMVNYVIDPALLESMVPQKTELDNWNNITFISLVGFLFSNTRVLGIKIPYHIDFPEVNLRIYVRCRQDSKWKRGVVFIKEIVPMPAITFVANTFFQERYETMALKHFHTEKDQQLHIAYEWKYKGRLNRIEAKADNVCYSLKNDSQEEFITEHFWGYSNSGSRTVEYHVEHPRWNLYKVNNFGVDCDFEKLYGQRFADLRTQIPNSVYLAEGSPVAVFTKRYI